MEEDSRHPIMYPACREQLHIAFPPSEVETEGEEESGGGEEDDRRATGRPA